MTQPIQGVIKVVPAKALGTKVVRKPGLERLGKRIDIDGLIYLSQDDLKPIRPMLASSQLPLVAVAREHFDPFLAFDALETWYVSPTRLGPAKRAKPLPSQSMFVFHTSKAYIQLCHIELLR